MRHAKRSKLRRSSDRYAAHGERIPRKVAWRVLGFSSPRAYHQWRDKRIRTESNADLWRADLWRPESVLFTRTWMLAQPREWRTDLRLPEVEGHYLDDIPYVVRPGDSPWSVSRRMSGQDSPAQERELARTNPTVSYGMWKGWESGITIYLPSTWSLWWWRGHDYWPTTYEQVSEWIEGPGPGECTIVGSGEDDEHEACVYASVVCSFCGHPPCWLCGVQPWWDGHEQWGGWIGWCDRVLDGPTGQMECCEAICNYPHKPLFFTLDAEGKRRPWKTTEIGATGEKTSGSKPA